MISTVAAVGNRFENLCGICFTETFPSREVPGLNVCIRWALQQREAERREQEEAQYQADLAIMKGKGKGLDGDESDES